MSHLTDISAIDIKRSVDVVLSAAVQEVYRQATALVGEGPRPGTPEWEAETHTDVPVVRQRTWQLVCLRIEVQAGLDPLLEVLQLRRMGASWAEIGDAAGTSRQSAHERWGARVLAVLNRYGDGQLGGPVLSDDPVGV